MTQDYTPIQQDNRHPVLHNPWLNPVAYFMWVVGNVPFAIAFLLRRVGIASKQDKLDELYMHGKYAPRPDQQVG